MQEENKNIMYKISAFIVDRRKAFLVFFGIAIIYCLVRISDVGVENDVTKYLPENTETRQGVDIMDSEFETLCHDIGLIIGYIGKEHLCRAMGLKLAVHDIHALSGSRM